MGTLIGGSAQRAAELTHEPFVPGRAGALSSIG